MTLRSFMRFFLSGPESSSKNGRVSHDEAYPHRERANHT